MKENFARTARAICTILNACIRSNRRRQCLAC